VREQGLTGSCIPAPGADESARRGGAARTARFRRADPAAEYEDLVRLLRELSALLSAGRSGPDLWNDILVRRCPDSEQASGPEPFTRTGGNSGTPGNSNTAMLQLARRSSMLGLSVSAALRAACRERAPGLHQRRTGNAHVTRVWQELAACLDVAELSGAPLAAVLLRLAGACEADSDEAAVREISLAGPKATVRLLAWLPALGLGLGVLMGVDPFAILFGSPVGLAALLAGTAFIIAGRCWTAALISAVSGP
jgi:tight adherence protein B